MIDRFIAMALALLLFALVLAPACRTNQTPEQQAVDVQITAKIKANLAKNVRLATLTNVDVNTSNRVVTLSGTVSSEEERKLVEAEAKAVEGVTRVANNVQVVQVATAPS